MANSANSPGWGEEDVMKSTVDPNVSVLAIADEVPAVTVATTIGVTVVILVGIAAVFLLGVLIDWRQQKVLDRKMGAARRLKNQQRVNVHPEDDHTSIANNMEEPGLSIPPLEAIRTIP